MATGTIYRIVKDHGYAWIRTPARVDYFLHRSELRNTTFEALQEGNEATFTPVETAKGPRATEAYVTEAVGC